MKEIFVSFEKYEGDIKDTLIYLLENGISKFVFTEMPPEYFNLGIFEAYIVNDNKIRVLQRDTGTNEGVTENSGLIVRVDSKDAEDYAVQVGNSYDFVIIETSSWKVIPLENIIASYQGDGVKLFAMTDDASEIDTLLGILETGVDGIYYTPRNFEEITKNIDSVKKIFTDNRHFEFISGTVEEIFPAGNGDRVCIDTCSILHEGEGMLIGSQSDSFYFVHSETISSEYVNTRPFRVNAGPVHSYILMPNGKTKYLSEIRSGDRVLVVNSNGDSRIVTVGRVKIEERPLTGIRCIAGGRETGVILQNAETVRLVDSEMKPVSVPFLKKGMKVLVYGEDGGRHFGMKIKEKINEK